VTGTRKA